MKSNSPAKCSLLLIMVIITAVVSLKAVNFVAENYFFDKVFYKKSLVHGYLTDCSIPGCHLERYGRRSSDIARIFAGSRDSSIVLGTSDSSDEDVFKIAVIGDSFVWGVGIRDEERFAVLLENKLDKIKNTTVDSYGFPGDSLLDNLVKYKFIEQYGDYDLYIFFMVDNDLLYNSMKNYPSELYNDMLTSCPEIPGEFSYDTEEYLDNKGYVGLIEGSFKNPKNICIADKILGLLPAERSIYLQTTVDPIIFKSYGNFNSLYAKHGLNMIPTSKGKEIDSYKKYWANPEKYFYVSETEMHPSGIANRMYADILFGEITNNTKYGF